MTYPQPHDSAHVFGLLTSVCVLQKQSGPASATNASLGLTNNANWSSDCMAHEAHNAPSAQTQRFIDPVIEQARFINEAAALDRALAMRKALRPQRSDAAKRGWEARRG